MNIKILDDLSFKLSFIVRIIVNLIIVRELFLKGLHVTQQLDDLNSPSFYFGGNANQENGREDSCKLLFWIFQERLGSNGGVKTFQKPVRLILAARVGKWPNLSIYYSVKEEQDSPLITQQDQTLRRKQRKTRPFNSCCSCG